MRCGADLTLVSTNSLPSTLLKKTGGRKQIPFHDRVVVAGDNNGPPVTTITKFDERNETDIQHELSSVSTQSTPSISQSSRTTPSQIRSPTNRREVAVSVADGSPGIPSMGTTLQIGPNDDSQKNYIDNQNCRSTHQQLRPPSPERNIRSSKSTIPTRIEGTSKSSDRLVIRAKNDDNDRYARRSSSNRSVKSDYFDAIMTMSVGNTGTTTSPTTTVDFTESILQHPSIQNRSVSTPPVHHQQIIHISDNNIKRYNNNSNKNFNVTTDNKSEVVVGRTIPFSGGSSVKALCSNDDRDDVDDIDERHRYMVTITTSRSTIKASGGRNDYNIATTTPMKSYSFGNYSTQFEEEGDDDRDEDDDDDDYGSSKIIEVTDVLHENKQKCNFTVSQKMDTVPTSKLQMERDNDILSAAKSRRSIGKLSTIVSEPSRSDNASSTLPSIKTLRSENDNKDNSNNSTMVSRGVGGSHQRHRPTSSGVSQTTSQNRRYSNPSDEHVSVHSRNNKTNVVSKKLSDRILDDELSQSKTLSSTRFIIDDDIVEARRESEILSAAASRKSGRTGKLSTYSEYTSSSTTSQSREVLIEEYEKPKYDDVKSFTKSATAWKKIDDVLFSDDQSELHLFKTPAKDVAFDDLLTTTSDCSSISVSLDPSGCIINETNVSIHRPATTDQGVPNMIKDVEFNRVKSILDRMRKPMTIHTTTAAAAATTINTTIPNVTTNRGASGGMVSFNAPKMKNRIGTSNFVQNRFKNTPQVSIIRAATQLEQSRNNNRMGVSSSKRDNNIQAMNSDAPLIVQAASFHGNAHGRSIVESVAVPSSSPIQSTAGSSGGRKDPPANTLCSERR